MNDTKKVSSKYFTSSNIKYLYYDNGNISVKKWYNNSDQLHKFSGPAVIFYDKDGNIMIEKWYFNGNKIYERNHI